MLAQQHVGEGIGQPGFYFTVAKDERRLYVRYIRAMRETIRVYASGDEVRADHVLRFAGLTFLRLHNRLRRTAAQSARLAAVSERLTH